MAQKVLNTFNNGIDKDTSINKYNNSNYFDAKNVRLITNDSLNSGALSNFQAPDTILTSPYSLGGDIQGRIIGVTSVRDTLVLFYVVTSSATHNGTSMIFKKEYSSNVYELVYSDYSFTEKLNFDEDYPIQAIGRYESPTIQKVYWCDGLNVNRYINIAIDNTSTEPDKFSLAPNSELESPLVTDVISGGTLESGTISYAYQLYIKNGTETSISGHSTVIPLSSRNGEELENFRGDEVGVDTGNSVLLEINNLDTGFDRIRLYSIHYSDLNADPTISVIAESDFSSSTFNFIDTGTSSLYTLTTSEYNLLKGRIFSSKTLETKKNYLFAGNIKEIRRDIDFDARTYRFRRTYQPGLSGTVTSNDPTTFTVNFSQDLGDLGGTGIDILVNGISTDTVTVNSRPSATSYVFNRNVLGTGITTVGSTVVTEYNSNYISCNIYQADDIGYTSPTNVTNLNWDTIDEDHDAVNPFNDFDHDYEIDYTGQRTSSYEYKFWYSDGITLGGRGPNISYRFYTEDIEANTNSKPAGTSYNTIRDINTETNSFLDPVVNSKFKGYKRGEIYRFGIEFVFKNGQKSFVKWIGDIRFPFLHEESLTSTSSTIEYNTQLGVKFFVDLSNVATEDRNDLSGYRIVRVERKEYDKNILYQGLGGPIVETTGFTGISDGTLAFPNQITTIANAYGGTNNNANAPVNVNYYEINSPNINIYPTKYSFKASDKLYAVGSHESFDLNSNTTGDGDVFHEASYKQSSTAFTLIEDISTFKIANTSLAQGTPSLGVFDGNSIYYRAVQCNSPGDDLDGIIAKKGLFDVTAFDLSVIQAYVGASERMILEHSRNRFRSQYGGLSYENRQTNSFIPVVNVLGTSLTSDATDFITITYHDDNSPSDTLEVNIFGGDTYVVNFDLLRVNFDGNISAGVDTMQYYITVPLETDINLEYRRDEINKYFTGYPDHVADSTIYKLQNTYTDGVNMYPDNYPEEVTDLYLYNDAYSRLNNIISNTTVPSDFTDEELFDTMILGSNKKFNGEYVDSWLKYDFNTFLEVDSAFGQITRLIKHDENLLFFQEDGFGTLAVEDRVTVPDDTGNILSLGTGPSLERYDYISTNYGITRAESIISTEDNLFFIDEQDKSIRVLGTDNRSNFGKIQGISSLIKSLLPSTYIALGYDAVNKELLISLDTTTLCINTMGNKFTSEYDIVAHPTSVLSSGYHRAAYYIDIRDELHNLFTELVTTYDTIHMDKLNSANYPLGNNSDISILIHPNGTDVFRFDTLDIRTSSFDSITDDLTTSLDTNTDGLYQITYQNSYLSPVTVVLTTGSNINRLARKWRTKIPLTANSNRFVDTYLIATLRFRNNVTNNKYILHDIISNVMLVNK